MRLLTYRSCRNSASFERRRPQRASIRVRQMRYKQSSLSARRYGLLRLRSAVTPRYSAGPANTSRLPSMSLTMKLRVPQAAGGL